MTWIKTTASFIPHDLSDEEFECYNDEQKEEHSENRLFRFNTDAVIAYNESYDGSVSLRMVSGYEITVNMGIKEMDKIIYDK